MEEKNFWFFRGRRGQSLSCYLKESCNQFECDSHKKRGRGEANLTRRRSAIKLSGGVSQTLHRAKGGRRLYWKILDRSWKTQFAGGFQLGTNGGLRCENHQWESKKALIHDLYFGGGSDSLSKKLKGKHKHRFRRG